MRDGPKRHSGLPRIRGGAPLSLRYAPAWGVCLHEQGRSRLVDARVREEGAGSHHRHAVSVDEVIQRVGRDARAGIGREPGGPHAGVERGAAPDSPIPWLPAESRRSADSEAPQSARSAKSAIGFRPPGGLGKAGAGRREPPGLAGSPGPCGVEMWRGGSGAFFTAYRKNYISKLRCPILAGFGVFWRVFWHVHRPWQTGHLGARDRGTKGQEGQVKSRPCLWEAVREVARFGAVFLSQATRSPGRARRVEQ